jgi:hypothetical protein
MSPYEPDFFASLTMKNTSPETIFLDKEYLIMTCDFYAPFSFNGSLDSVVPSLIVFNNVHFDLNYDSVSLTNSRYASAYDNKDEAKDNILKFLSRNTTLPDTAFGKRQYYKIPPGCSIKLSHIFKTSGSGYEVLPPLTANDVKDVDVKFAFTARFISGDSKTVRCGWLVSKESALLKKLIFNLP